MTAIDLAACVLLLAGSLFVLLAAAGLWRLEDVFSRIHAATKAITLGVLLAGAGAALRMEHAPDLLKLLLAAVLQLISAPVAGHMLGRAAYWAGMQSGTHTVVDHLRNRQGDIGPGRPPF